MEAGRVVGVDVGTKRVGLAKSDPLGMFAQPVGTYAPSEALEIIREIDRQDGIRRVVVGWPLTEDGKEGKATKMVNEYVRRLRKVIDRPKVTRLDERYTSEEARSRALETGSKMAVDTIAAGIILQEYLDSEPE